MTASFSLDFLLNSGDEKRREKSPKKRCCHSLIASAPITLVFVNPVSNALSASRNEKDAYLYRGGASLRFRS